MAWNSVLYFISVLIAAPLMGAIAVYAWRHRTVPGARVYAVIALGVCLLVALEGLVMISPSKDWAFFWFDLRQICFSGLPVLWLIFALQYAGMSGFVTPVRAAVLFVIPILSQVMLWTNSRHGLWVGQNVDFYRAGPFFIVDTSVRILGPWMKLHLVYSYILTIMGLLFLIFTAVSLSGPDRRRMLAVITGTLAMVVGALFPTFNLLPGSAFNPLTVGFAAGSLMIGWGVFGLGFLKAAPAAPREGQYISVSLAALFLALTCGIVLAGYFHFRQFEKNYRLEVGQKLGAIVQLKVEDLTNWRKERLADALILHDNPYITGLVLGVVDPPGKDGMHKRLTVWLGKYLSHYHYKNLLVLDAKGGLVLSAAAVTPDERVQVQNEVRKIDDWTTVRFLDFSRSAPDGPVELKILVPVTEQGRPVGVIALIIDPSTFVYPMLQRWPTESLTGETLLVRRDGGHVVYLNELKFRKNTALNLRFPLTQTSLPAARAALGGEGVAEGVDYRGEKVLAAFRAVPGTPWFMVARIDQQEIFAPIRARFGFMVLLMTALTSLAGAVVWYLWRRQSKQFQRRQLEVAKAMQTSEEKFRKIFLTSPDASAITRLDDGQIVSVNPAFVRLSGHTEEELAGARVSDMRIWENNEDRCKMIGLLKENGRVNNFEARLRKKYGGLIHTLTSASLFELDGAPHVLTMTRDITERIMTEDMIRESERRLREAQEMARLGFWRWNVETGAVEWSQELFEIYGLDAKNFTPRFDSILALSARPADRLRDQEILHRAMTSRRPESFEQMFMRPDQSVGYCLSTVRGDYDDEGELISVVGTVLDITERKLAEEAVRRLNEELERKVKERTADLTAKTAELERINKVFVDRELKMRDLKARIVKLEEKS